MARRKARKPVIERTPGGYVVNLDHEEIDLVVRLAGELRTLLLGDDPQLAPLMRRLFPPAYHLTDDAAAEVEYQRLMREEIVASRLAAINGMEAALLAEAPFDEPTMTGFMQAVNGVRLVLGTLLDVSEDLDPADIPDDDPMVGEHQLYAFLGWLLDSAVRAVMQGT